MAIVDQEIVVDIVKRLPQGLVSRGWGWLARVKRPRVFVSAYKRAFVKSMGIDMSESAEPMESFDTLEDLFVRHLRKGARRIDPQPEAFICPVDGRVGMCGKVTDGILLQVKGRSYALANLLGDEATAQRFEGGHYATIYLAPHDYHRIHSPIAGKVARAMLIPGALMPVFKSAIENVDELFARNERLISYVDSPTAGQVAVVKVGATMVGRISLAYDDSIHTNRPGQLKRNLEYSPSIAVAKGGELGSFELGSTVVILTEPGKVEINLVSESPVQMGQRIGTIKLPKKSSPARNKESAKKKPVQKKSAKKKSTKKKVSKKKSQ